MTREEYEKKMLSLPIARDLSPVHSQHTFGENEFQQMEESSNCGCDRCKIIRIKKMRMVSRLKNPFPNFSCIVCGEPHVSIYKVCQNCRGLQGL